MRPACSSWPSRNSATHVCRLQGNLGAHSLRPMTQCLEQMSKSVKRKAEILSLFISMNCNIAGRKVVDSYNLVGRVYDRGKISRKSKCSFGVLSQGFCRPSSNGVVLRQVEHCWSNLTGFWQQGMVTFWRCAWVCFGREFRIRTDSYCCHSSVSYRSIHIPLDLYWRS